MKPPQDSTPFLSVPADISREPRPAADDDERYRDIAPLGRGGMGEVRTVYDTQLDRQVARKFARPEVLGSSEALAREARLTAGLEHPGIIPVYDAGQDSEGRPWYTMRLVRGRHLRAVIANEPTLGQRLALLRPLLAAVEAVAYAHERGVVHCDLKATNILLGEHGQVQVVDWGLAGASLERSSGGTPASMAPEQARGEPATPASDVWGLGLMLWEVIRAVPTVEPPTERELAKWLRSPEAAAVPADLRAILQRCLERDPSSRYASAGALAQDLASFLDGRMVGARAYSTTEVLTRLIVRHRVVVGVAAVAALAVTVVTSTAGLRVIREREAAQEAEELTRQALEQSDRNLSDALLLAARTAARQAKRPEAETLAAGALALGDSPEARGILASFAASPRPERVSWPLPSCDGLLRATPAGLICVGSEVLALHPWQGEGWEVPVRVDEAVWAGRSVFATLSGNHLAIFDANTGVERTRIAGLPTTRGLLADRDGSWLKAGHELLAIAADGTVRRFLPCDGRGIGSVAPLASGAVAVSCGPQGLVELHPDTSRVHVVPLVIPDPRASVRFAAACLEDALVLGTDRGEIIGLRGGEQSFTTDVGEPVLGLWWTGQGTRVVADLRSGGAAVLDGTSGSLLTRLPAVAGRGLGAEGAHGFLTEDGSRWELGELAPVALGGGGGITALWPDPRGGLWLARGNGQVDRWNDQTGGLVGTRSWSPRALKGLAPVPGRGGVAAVGVEGGLRVIPDGLESDEVVLEIVGRRLVVLGTHWVVLRYLAGGSRVFADGRWEPLAPIGTPSWFDIGTDPSHTLAAALGEDGQVWRIEAGGSAQSLGIFDGATAIDIGRSGRIVVTLRSGDLLVLEANGESRRLGTSTPLSLDLALAPAEDQVALGGLDGVVRIVGLADGALHARLDGHEERVSIVTWTDDTHLWSGSWDGTARRWSLVDLHRPPSDLVARAEHSWGLTVTEALAALSPSTAHRSE